jgi:DAACS family dicarboxylate/amino acid:cation (Na+ or H+) symporter
VKSYQKLLLALVFGALLGTLLHHQAANSEFILTLIKNVAEPIGQIFLRLIFMIVVPLVFTGLVLGVYQLSQHHDLGKVASRTLIYTLIASMSSVFIGITLANILKPGSGLSQNTALEAVAAQSSSIEKIKANAQAAKSVSQTIVDLVPKNPIDSAARALDGEMISLMVFALIFALALSKTYKGSATPTLINLAEQIYETSMTIIHMVMRLAPLAVFCLVFTTSFKFGHELLLSLGSYVFVVLLGFAVQQFGVYSFMLKYLAKMNPWAFFEKCREVYIYAFATSSSNATLPRSLETATDKLKLSPEISRFVLTVGSTANQNGTALFEGVTILFLAQVYNIDLTLAQQTQVVLMSILAGVGTAGVPGGSLPLIMILLQQLGIPAEGMGIILGVDRFLDMCRTTINVSGDLVIAAVVDKTQATP